MPIKYTKEFLISELQRFVLENGRNPIQLDMQTKYGYPPKCNYSNYFGTWNKSLLKAGLKINQCPTYNQNIIKICDNCGAIKQKSQWRYKNSQRLCLSCYKDSDCKQGNLDPNSEVGFGFIGQRVVAKTLGLDLKYDCNCSEGFGSPYDLYDKNGYDKIDVKSATMYDDTWYFNLGILLDNISIIKSNPILSLYDEFSHSLNLRTLNSCPSLKV